MWKASKYGVISGPYFPVFGLYTGKYGPDITPYLDTFHAVIESSFKDPNDTSSLLYHCASISEISKEHCVKMSKYANLCIQSEYRKTHTPGEHFSRNKRSKMLYGSSFCLYIIFWKQDWSPQSKESADNYH